MAGWNGSGLWERFHNWVADRDASIDITASRFDEENDTIASGLNNCLTKDGQNSPTANLPMSTRKHTNVGNSVARNEYAATGQVQDSDFIYAVDTGTANTYAIAPSPTVTAYKAGQLFSFKALNANTGASTLNVSSLGAKTIKKQGNTDLVSGDIAANDVYDVRYDGTTFQLRSFDKTSSVVENNVANEYTRTQNFNATTLTDGATINWDLSQNQATSVTLAGNRTLANPTNKVDGATYILKVIQDVTGTRTLTFSSDYKFPGGVAPLLSTGSNEYDIISFYCDGTNMNGIANYNFS